MTTPNEGTPAVPGQAQPSIPVTPEQPVSQAAPIAPTAAQPTAEAPATPPQIPAEVQARLEAAEARATELEKQARYHQSRADQEANRVRALAGIQQPQANPLEPYMKQYTDMGIAESDAKVLAQRDYQTDQRFNSLQSSITAQSQIPAIMQQLYGQSPHLFQNPQVQQAMQNALIEAVNSGQPQYVTPEYAFQVGAAEFVRSMNTQPAQVAPPAQPQFRSQFGPVGQFTPPAMPMQTQAQVAPHLQAAAKAEQAAIAQRFNFQPPSR